MSSPDASETLARRGRGRVSVARWAPRLQTSNRHRVYVARSAAGARGRGRPPRSGQRREGGRGGDAEGTDPGAGGPWELKGLLGRVSEKSGHMIARSGPREVTGNRSPGTPGTNAQMKTGEKVTCHLWWSRARSRAMTSSPRTGRHSQAAIRRCRSAGLRRSAEKARETPKKKKKKKCGRKFRNWDAEEAAEPQECRRRGCRRQTRQERASSQPEPWTGSRTAAPGVLKAEAGWDTGRKRFGEGHSEQQVLPGSPHRPVKPGTVQPPAHPRAGGFVPREAQPERF